MSRAAARTSGREVLDLIWRKDAEPCGGHIEHAMRNGPSFPADSAFGLLLEGLHASTCQLMFRIESDRRSGKCTARLEQELSAKEGEARAFMAYLAPL